ncbi:MAG: hypothetical protein A2928_04245 [Candidatus Taylorbacteria bacterium RIFCSPLOWO2_01_FULL_45_15b]|uniref:DNA polymerase III subunit delta n=1 Tax=Candidatus Taylorbacteria bacterium RIFCSPLOWO2_01_FULL_45_15b TaxID=1802319 RepID=A0A1G2NEL2_9BACT|nr:MAG: hypothetical protein A2928_04245 [Candidatus Taylorbacteria bacterium RIFCSPLOWO2_01_FULL_45_15b]
MKNDFVVHHAYCIESNPEAGKNYARDHIAKTHGESFLKTSLVELIYETLTIDGARKLIALQSRTPLYEKQFFITLASSLTRETEHALLKMFEDPTPNTHHYLITPRIGALLPTLQSRLHILDMDRDEKIVFKSAEAEQFAQSNIGERLAFTKKMADAMEKSQILRFLDELEVLLYTKGLSDKRALQKIMDAKKILHSRGASVKMTLDEIALSV